MWGGQGDTYMKRLGDLWGHRNSSLFICIIKVDKLSPKIFAFRDEFDQFYWIVMKIRDEQNWDSWVGIRKGVQPEWQRSINKKRLNV